MVAMYEELLAGAPLFHDLPLRELRWLGDACRERDYAPGETLMRQGHGGAGLIFILDGRARATALAPDGAERELGSVEAGATLGELATLDESASPITVTALTLVHAIVLPVWDFRDTLRENPEIGIHLLAIAGRRLRENAAANETP